MCVCAGGLDEAVILISGKRLTAFLTIVRNLSCFKQRFFLYLVSMGALIDTGAALEGFTRKKGGYIICRGAL